MITHYRVKLYVSCFRKKKSKKQIRVEGVQPSNRGQDARDTFFPKVCLTSILQKPYWI